MNMHKEAEPLIPRITEFYTLLPNETDRVSSYTVRQAILNIPKNSGYQISKHHMIYSDSD